VDAGLVVADPAIHRRLGSTLILMSGTYLLHRVITPVADPPPRSQSHIKKASPAMRLVVQPSGIQLFDTSNARPADSMLYAELKGGWRSTPYELVLLKQEVRDVQIRSARAKNGMNSVGIVFLKTAEGAAIQEAMNAQWIDEVEFSNPADTDVSEEEEDTERSPVAFVSGSSSEQVRAAGLRMLGGQVCF
jgi:hypothetical protein